MRTFVDTMDSWLTAEDVVLNLEGCLGCGLCGQACAWFLETNDERLHPKNRSDFIRKVYKRYLTPEGKLLGPLGLIETPSVEDLKAHMDIYWKCTACGRCTMACPVGISNRRLYRIFRAAYAESGLSLENPTIKAIVDNTRDKKHSFGLLPEEVFGRTGMFLQYQDVEMPVDVYGAEYMFVCPAAGNTKIPELGIKVIKILNAGQVDYTISTRITDTGTEIDHIVVHHSLSQQMLIDWENEAERLGVQKVVVAECGCDVRTMYVEATETLGRPFKFPIVDIDTIFEELIDTGRIPVEQIDESVTFHDPCYITRLSGMGDRYREFMPKLTKDFREMTPNREQNYCCNAGSGGMRLPENTDLRRKVSRLKADQIERTQADYVTSPCAVCYTSLKDITEHYGMVKPNERRARMFFEIVYDAMVKALTKLGELDRMKTPKLFENADPKLLEQYSLDSYMKQFINHPLAPMYLEKFKTDVNVLNFARENPGFMEHLDHMANEVNVHA